MFRLSSVSVSLTFVMQLFVVVDDFRCERKLINAFDQRLRVAFQYIDSVRNWSFDNLSARGRYKTRLARQQFRLVVTELPIAVVDHPFIAEQGHDLAPSSWHLTNDNAPCVSIRSMNDRM